MNPFANRRAFLLALACGPFLCAAAAPAPKRLAIMVFRAGQPGLDELEQVVRLLGPRGFAEGRQLEVVRVAIDAAPEDEPKSGLDYLVPRIEREVIPLKPDVILTMGSAATKGAWLATRTIPIVTNVPDPVDLGVAASLARPGGNVTGLAHGLEATSVKTMELMKAFIPRLSRVAIFHVGLPVPTRLAGHFERAARSVGLEPVMVSATQEGENLRALRGLSAKRIQAGVWVSGLDELDEAARVAIAARLPLVGVQEDSVEAGCLFSFYSVDPDPYPKLAAIVERILQGADPAGIPFQYPTTFRLVINRRTAKALGLVVRPDLLLRADRVIE